MVKRTTARAANHLRAWRERAGMTQEQLAEKAGTAGNVISLLESGQRELSDKWLRRLAPPLQTRPGYLRDYHPDTVPNDILELWADIPEDRRAEVREILKVFRQKDV